VINIFGRPLKLTSCDEFTKAHYASKFEVQSFPVLPNKAEPQPVKPVPRIVHAYNGFGSEEDSLGSTKSLVPKPNQKDFSKFLKFDR
jgi:hypothetical protein